jgi:hypothetical protein
MDKKNNHKIFRNSLKFGSLVGHNNFSLTTCIHKFEYQIEMNSSLVEPIYYGRCSKCGFLIDEDEMRKEMNKINNKE